MNHVKRQNEMDKISRENQAILRRIQTVRPQYSIRKWEGDFEVHKTRTKALSLFPPIEVSKQWDYMYTRKRIIAIIVVG